MVLVLFMVGHLQSAEREMQQIPSSRKRGGGIMKYKYTDEDCACEYCTEYSERRRKCMAEKCICMKEKNKVEPEIEEKRGQ